MNLSQMQTTLKGGVGAQLDELDVLISRTGSKNSKDALQLLRLMDSVDAQIRHLEEQGANVRVLSGQFESACAALRKQSASLVRDVGGAAALKAEREKRDPPTEAWWWRLDEYVADRHRERLLRTVKWGAALAILGGLLVAAYLIFFAPSPAMMARYTAIDKTTMLAQSGNYTEALAALKKGLDEAPDDPDLLLWMGIIYTVQGNDQQAAGFFTRVQGEVAGSEEFYLRRAQDYLAIGQNVRAEQDAQAAINANSKSARGYYILASAQENAGDVQSAMKNYQAVINLADPVNDSSLIVEAKVKMGYILQGAGSLGVSTQTPIVRTETP